MDFSLAEAVRKQIERIQRAELIQPIYRTVVMSSLAGAAALGIVNSEVNICYLNSAVCR